MDQNLTYQKARRIRGTKLTDLLADQLMYEPTLAKAVGKTISLKFQSKIRGVQAKFDPLNIVKFLTGGSKIAPALLGRMLGRDIRDIEYFTGRSKPLRVGPSRSTYSKITPVPGESGDIEGINEQLLKIYKFLKTSNENETKRRQKEQNFAEEKQIESERRHKEFLNALMKLKTGKTKATVVTKEEKESFDFGGLVSGIISKVKDMVQNMIDSALKVYEWVNDLKILTKIVQFVPKLLSVLGWFTSPLGIALLGIATPLALLAYLASIEKDKIEENPYKPEYKDNPYAMKLRGEAKTVAEAGQKNIAKVIKTYRRNEIQEFVDSKLNDDELMEEFGLNRAGLKKWLDNNKSKGAVYQAPVKGAGFSGGSSVAPMPDETAAETARLSRQNAAAVKTPSVVQQPIQKEEVTPAPRAEMIPVSTSNQLNTVMAENVDANLLSKPNNETQSIVNNLIQNSSNQQQKIARLDEIAVHNDEPTFLRMIMNSTRLV